MVALLTCLISCVIVRVKKRGRHLPIEHQFLMQDHASYGHMTPSYIPYTVPKAVQASIAKAASPPYHLPVSVSGRHYYAEHIRAVDYPNSSRSEPAINRAGSLDDRYSSKLVPKLREPYLRSGSLLNGSYKMPSRPSSRASSLRSEPIEPIDMEPNRNFLPSKEVYLHSSLLNTESQGVEANSEFEVTDYVVSYDQKGDVNEVEGKFPNGALILSLFYDSDASQLVVVIRQAIDLPVSQVREEDIEVYVNFCILPEDFYWQRTESVMHTHHPIFEQSFKIPDVLHHKLRQYTLCFLVMDSSGLQETIVGKVMVPLSELRAGIDLEMCRELGTD